MYLQIYIYHEQQILQLHSFAFHVFMDLLKDCAVSFSLISFGAEYHRMLPLKIKAFMP